MIDKLRTIEMHTGGEPVRIIVDGYPSVPGATLLEKRRYVSQNLDHLRKLVIFEPRGHCDMYALVLVKPDIPDADVGVLFMHNEGYSTMCGHAIIALGRYLVDHRLVDPKEPETTVKIQCPCGMITTHVSVKNGKSGAVRFESVPSFAFARDKTIMTDAFGLVTLDIGYGGAFYAIVEANQFGLNLRKSNLHDMIGAATTISEAVRQQVPLHHPDGDDLAFLYGTILTDGSDEPSNETSVNVCVFANAQVDRSPTGSGVAARVALQYRRGLIDLQYKRAFESITGAVFTARALKEIRCDKFPAVTVEVSGIAHYIGESIFHLENGDDIGEGFLLH